MQSILNQHEGTPMSISKCDDFSVLLPTFNREDLYILFDRAVQSIFLNTVIPKETIVIVDGPVTNEFRDKIINYEKLYDLSVIWLPDNVGLTMALNIGLSHVKTKWVVRADGDDFNLPERFEKQLTVLRKGYHLVGGSIQEVDEGGKFLKIRRVPLEHIEIVKMLKRRNPFNHMSVAFSTEFAKEIGGYPNIYLKEDYGFWCLFIKNGAKTANLPDILVHATTGLKLFSRRSGLKYIKSEIDLQKYLVACGLSTVCESLFFGSLRCIAFAMPASIKKLIYLNLLRD
jgi:glycosyltransferase involved in cell wall biosynthesis